MMEKPISSPMNKSDTTIVTKTKSSQKTNCDHSGVFNDINVTSLMTTSLLVSIGRMPGDRTLRSLDASHAIPTRVLRFEVSGLRRRTPVRPVLPTSQTRRSDGLELLQHRLWFFGLGFVDQPRNPVVFW
jgi:hypothetical protein